MTQTKSTDPRVVGGRYLSGYWRQAYTVTAIGRNGLGDTCWTCEWDDGRTTTHSTAWDPRRDRIIHTQEG